MVRIRRIAVFLILFTLMTNAARAQSPLTFGSASLSWSDITGKIEHHFLDGVTDSTFDTLLSASCLSSISDIDACSFGCPASFGNQYVSSDQLPVSSLIVGDTTISATESVTNSPQTYVETFKLAIRVNALHTICSQIDYDYQRSTTHGPSGSVGEHYTLLGTFPFQIDSSRGWAFRVHVANTTLQEALVSLRASLVLSSNQNRPHEITENGFDSLIMGANASLDLNIQGSSADVHTASWSQEISFLPSLEGGIQFVMPKTIKGSVQAYNTLGELLGGQNILPGPNLLSLPPDHHGLVILRFPNKSREWPTLRHFKEASGRISFPFTGS